MTDISSREMEMTAELVRERLWKHPELELLRAAEIQVMMGYGSTAVSLQIGDRLVSRIDWIHWREGGLETREDHAGWIAHRLGLEWKRSKN